MRLPSSLIHQTITWIHLDTVQRLLWDYCFGLLVLIELKLMNVFCVCDVFVSVNVEGICVPLLCILTIRSVQSVAHFCVYEIIFFMCISTQLFLFCFGVSME
eukprot:1094802_1